MERTWIIDAGDQRIVFDDAHGVMPASVSLKNYDGVYETIVDGDRSGFTVTKEDGRSTAVAKSTAR